jgi:hypothetical protein
MMIQKPNFWHVALQVPIRSSYSAITGSWRSVLVMCLTSSSYPRSPRSMRWSMYPSFTLAYHHLSVCATGPSALRRQVGSMLNTHGDPPTSPRPLRWQGGGASANVVVGMPMSHITSENKAPVSKIFKSALVWRQSVFEEGEGMSWDNAPYGRSLMSLGSKELHRSQHHLELHVT